MQQPVISFRQVLTSSTTSVDLHPGQETELPIRVANPGSETWDSTGRFPITISYKWFKNGEMLPVEGERTVLPSPVGPGQTVDADVRVVAPGEPGEYALRVSLVQEGVQWFMVNSGEYLELPASVQ
jgi:hypothetical protein